MYKYYIIRDCFFIIIIVNIINIWCDIKFNMYANK